MISSWSQRGGVLGYGANTFDSLFWGLPLAAVPLYRIPLSCPDEPFRSRTCLRGGQVPAVQLQWHSTLPHRTAGLPSLSLGVGRLCARDQTWRELFPQRVHNASTEADWSYSPTILSPIGVPDGVILPNDNTAEVLAVEVALGERGGHWPFSMFTSSRPWFWCSSGGLLRSDGGSPGQAADRR